MGNPISGIGGLVKNGANVIANLDVWAIAMKSLTKEVTPFQADGSWQVNIATLKTWTVKLNGRLDPEDTAGQVAFLNGLGSTFTIRLESSSTRYWSGTGIVIGLDPKVNVNDAQLIEFDLMGTGPLVFTAS